MKNKLNVINPRVKQSPWTVKSFQGFLNFKDFPKWTRLLLWLLSETWTKPYVWELMSRMRTLHTKNGSFFLVLYLKEAHRLLLKAIAGQPEKCLPGTIRVATRRGLPTIIPGPLRLAIEKKCQNTIRLVLSVITLYRVIKCKPILKLSTITDPFKGVQETLSIAELRHALVSMLGVRRLYIDEASDLIPSTKAGPNMNPAALGATLDAIAFREAPELLESLRVVADTLAPSLYKLLEEEISISKMWESTITPQLREKVLSELKLGKLSEKLEAAGKVRVFAITDLWSQSILAPLHNAIMIALRGLVTDGTFDQLAPLRRLMDRGHKEFWSFDLSAATDRLPVLLQEQVLGLLISPSFAKAWRHLLVGRPWYHKGVPFYYSVGQPMGALSSWGMLALTHHLLVQIAAYRVGHRRFFSDYAVLGDDLVIANERVAESYLSLMEYLGVDINLSKSLISRAGIAEFAKRLLASVVDETKTSTEEAATFADYSPVPPRLVAALMNRFSSLPTVLRDLMSRGGPIRLKEVLSYSDIKTGKPLSTSLLWDIIGPLGFIPSVGLTPFLVVNSLTPYELRLIADAVSQVVNRRVMQFFYKNQHDSQDVVDRVGTLVWDRHWVLGDVMKRADLSFDTPAFHHLMDRMINTTIYQNSSLPNIIGWEEGREYTFENVYLYIQEAVEHLEKYTSLTTDFTQRTKENPYSRSSKMKFYKDLHKVLDSYGHNFGCKPLLVQPEDPDHAEATK